VIWDSTKKTDKEDALKPARHIQRYPEEELPVVPLISEKEEADRATVNMIRHFKRNRTGAVNKLHAFSGQSGIVDIKKTDLPEKAVREITVKKLPESLNAFASMLCSGIDLCDEQISKLEEKARESPGNNERTSYIMSIPGAGHGIDCAVLSYLGNDGRFPGAAEAANYAGLMPRAVVPWRRIITGIYRRGRIARR